LTHAATEAFNVEGRKEESFFRVSGGSSGRVAAVTALHVSISVTLKVVSSVLRPTLPFANRRFIVVSQNSVIEFLMFSWSSASTTLAC
jgi:hypothetical protein